MSTSPSAVRRLRLVAPSESPPPITTLALRGLATVAVLAVVPGYAVHAQSSRPVDVAPVGNVSALVDVAPDSLMKALRTGDASSDLLASSRARADSSDRDADGNPLFWNMLGAFGGSSGTRTLAVAAVGGAGAFGASHLLSWASGGGAGAHATTAASTEAASAHVALAAERASAGSGDGAAAGYAAAAGDEAIRSLGLTRSFLGNDAWRLASGVSSNRVEDWRAPSLSLVTGLPANDWKNDWKTGSGQGVSSVPTGSTTHEPPLVSVTSSEPTAAPSDPGRVDASLVTPEPSAMVLLGGGLVMLGGMVRRRRAR